MEPILNLISFQDLTLTGLVIIVLLAIKGILKNSEGIKVFYEIIQNLKNRKSKQQRVFIENENNGKKRRAVVTELVEHQDFSISYGIRAKPEIMKKIVGFFGKKNLIYLKEDINNSIPLLEIVKGELKVSISTFDKIWDTFNKYAIKVIFYSGVILVGLGIIDMIISTNQTQWFESIKSGVIFWTMSIVYTWAFRRPFISAYRLMDKFEKLRS